MAGTNIIIRVTEDQKAAYEARAKELGMSVSAWLKGFADNDCDPVTTIDTSQVTPLITSKTLRKAVAKANPPAPKVATQVVQKAGIDIVVPEKKAGRQCGHMYCKNERARGAVGDCFL